MRRKTCEVVFSGVALLCVLGLIVALKTVWKPLPERPLTAAEAERVFRSLQVSYLE